MEWLRVKPMDVRNEERQIKNGWDSTKKKILHVWKIKNKVLEKLISDSL